MWAWIKVLLTAIGNFLKPLILKLVSRTGQLVCESAVIAVKTVAEDSTASTWQQKLEKGVSVAVANLEQQGLRMGVDFFLNEVIAAVTAAIAKRYDDTH